MQTCTKLSSICTHTHSQLFIAAAAEFGWVKVGSVFLLLRTRFQCFIINLRRLNKEELFFGTYVFLCFFVFLSFLGDSPYCTPEQYKDCAEPALGECALHAHVHIHTGFHVLWEHFRRNGFYSVHIVFLSPYPTPPVNLTEKYNLSNYIINGALCKYLTIFKPKNNISL